MGQVLDTLWATLRADARPRTARQITADCAQDRDFITRLLGNLVNDGLVIRSPGHTPSYYLADIDHAPVAAPRYDRQGRRIADRRVVDAVPLWRAIRAQSKRGPFDVPMIAMIAGTSVSSAANYVNRLRRAGYLRLLAGTWRGTPANFILVRDTGPRAPRVDHRRQRSVVTDPNTGGRFDISPGRVCLRMKPAVAETGGGVG